MVLAVGISGQQLRQSRDVAPREGQAAVFPPLLGLGSEWKITHRSRQRVNMKKAGELTPFTVRLTPPHMFARFFHLILAFLLFLLFQLLLRIPRAQGKMWGFHVD